jgi:uncharacterized beta-barrel protein YwiB (DUF1934 family)
MRNGMIRILAYIESGEGADTVEFTTEGRVSRDKDGCLLEYTESEVSGMRGSLTTLRITGDKVVMHREGFTSSVMEFVKGERYQSEYTTPYGVFTLEILTRHLTCDLDPEGRGTVDIHYDMSIRGLSQSVNRLTIEVL